MNIVEKAKSDILESRKPFDTALEALETMEVNRDIILANLKPFTLNL